VSRTEDSEKTAAGRPTGAGRRPSRRAVLLGGAATLAGLGGGAYLARDELTRWWWRLPGNRVERVPGAVDQPGAEWVPAAPGNYLEADRPYDFEIDRVVIHVVQGSYETALRVFQDPDHEAAAHYVVRARDGRLAQTVRELDVAYHAGNFRYNLRSVGIEHEGFVDRPEDFTDAMYRSSARLTADVCGRYGIPVDREHIVGHSEVPGADHTDPGRHWDWDRYLRLVAAARKDPG
jgi:hypothetical protein